MISFTQLLQSNVQQRGQQAAITYEDQSWSYEEVEHRVARLAAGLRKLGMDEGARVAMLSLNSARFQEFLFAVPWGGGVVNPVNTRWSAEEIAYSLEDCQTRILMIDKNFLPLLDEIKRLSPGLRHVIYADEGSEPDGLLNYEQLIAESLPVADAYRHDDDLLGVFYTGGTTGFPKGVMLSHKNVVMSGMILTAMFGTEENVNFLHAAPMFHLADLALGVVNFLRGANHVIVPSFSPEGVLEVIEKHQVTDLVLVPTMIRMLLDAPQFEASRVDSLKKISYGASPMPIKTIELATELMPNAKFYQIYGMTELSPAISVSMPENHTPASIENGMVRSAGRPGPLLRLKIMDANGDECPRGDVGEIVVRGPNVMQGYWNKPEATAEALVDGWMHTGDMGYLDESGYLFIVDRSKDMIISGGENVYSTEVENIISKHPSVSMVAVIGIPCDEWGEKVHAIIVPAASTTPTLDDIREFCREAIAGYKCPRSIELISEMPLSGAGKILKNELRKPYWDGYDTGVA